MQHNNMPLYNGGAIRLQGCCDSGSALNFEMLARLTHTELLHDDVNDAHVVVMAPGTPLPDNAILSYGSKSLQTVYDSELRQFCLYLKDGYPHQNPYYGVYAWQVSIVCACTAALLRGQPVLMMHCAMLERDGKAVLLCGESGIGKSTSSRRWCADGGSAIADDMVLLEFTEDSGILVHRLPTWSACRVSLEGKSYPFNPPLRLEHILALGRSEDGQEEHIRRIKPSEYFAQIYHCLFFHYQEVLRRLPVEYSFYGAQRLREWMDKLMSIYPPEALFASLTGNIRLTLKDYL